ncbi:MULTISPECIES: ATP phosphoribosyltransferase regulatory subunit [Roseibium]|uniref:ATP phosphoribosyltransferase regulatory subunit n=1 Tax=Roseibium TaxID=150830 RepID=UPI001B0EA75D|nr:MULTISPECIES: ATP phosphoribosyltransferase regulatory subunit [Roseibium]MCR9281572.1 ATP phosphoribosyltransferase regulatory subunit [Paracoccaceae bacterium]MEC9403762.1 ATP phosphoribosyltransferase regulatory subunit [Pseudomonadota bacterium]MBO6856221.1 ATP phosphoribosyltransferase regulatory subunit [Roseibium sp.]UES37215.1 ATP phosphoribosyltransferase regulatory subunit [Roseibium aggregatum]UES46243.1 ATP phosphoribosyltransferase regulatory subunit [Roseibium aggregatum]
MSGAAQVTGLAPEKIETVLGLFKAAGHDEVSPPILQPADVFLDLTGEDIRRRLYLTSGTDGLDLCLRPDFTIPVCRHHLAQDAVKLPAAYCYNGPVFRQRPDGLGEIPQLGAESLGRTDTAEADADLLALSVKALEEFGLSDIVIRIGDETLFAAVLEGLDLPTVWRRRLRDLFGETDRLTAAITRMAGASSSDDDSRDVRLGFLSALEGADPEAAHAVVEDLLSIAGISAVGGRTPSEIADRFLEQAALASGARGHDKAAETLSAYLALKADGASAAGMLRDFSRDFGLGLDTPIAAFEQRLAALEAKGIDPARLTFAAEFGRRLDYYSGFVFEIHAVNPPVEGPLVGGGRYDKLVTLLGAEDDVPAIGFSMWLDRIAASVRS